LKSKQNLAEQQLRLGEISGLHGVSGWVKVFSDTQPRENIFSYSPWQVYSGDSVLQMEIVHWRKQGKTLVAKLKGVDDREKARELLGATVAVDQSQLPSLSDDEFYWHQLVGMKVVTDFSGEVTEMGRVAELMETGSNDVLVVRSDEKEHLVPWVMNEFVSKVALEEQTIYVHWDPDF